MNEYFIYGVIFYSALAIAIWISWRTLSWTVRTSMVLWEGKKLDNALKLEGKELDNALKREELARRAAERLGE